MIYPLLFMFCLIFQSQALSAPIPIETTAWAQSDGTWSFEGPGTNKPDIWPYIHRSNRDGIARKFNLVNYYQLNGLSALLYGDPIDTTNRPYNPGHATFSISKSLGTPDFSTQKFVVPLDRQQHLYNEDLTDKNIVLEPGDYWFVAQGGSEGRIRLDQYGLDGNVTTPEPATLLLFGSGIAALAFRRRKTNHV